MLTTSLESWFAAAVFFQIFKVERLVFGVSLETSVDGVAGVTHRHIAHEGVDEPIHERHHAKCEHRVQRFTASKEENAGKASDHDNA